MHAVRQILAIEDDPVLGEHLQSSLDRHGYQVTLATDGPAGLALTGGDSFDLILLDLLLPGMDGLELLARLRSRDFTPVIIISALGDEGHRIRGFDYGADDYLPKPVSVPELLVRIEAVLRRVDYERSQPPPAAPGPLRFDEVRCDIFHRGQWLGLTTTEYRLLELLASCQGEVLSKPYLYQQVLRRGYSRHDRSLDMHVSNIRRKLARVGGAGLRLEAVWGQGYLLRQQEG